MFVYGGVYGMEALCEGCATQSIESGFGSDDLYNDQTRPGRLGQNCLDIFDGNRFGHMWSFDVGSAGGVLWPAASGQCRVSSLVFN